MLDLVLPPDTIDMIMSKGRQMLHDDLRRGWHVKSVIAVHNQARLAKAFEEAVPLHHPVLGQLTLVVDPVIYEEMRREHGRDCWRDPDFRRRMAKLNPEMNVRSKSKNTTIRVDGLRSTPVRASAL